MNELFQKAIEHSNRMEVIENQLFILKEEYTQNLNYYSSGGTFKVSKELIVFVKTLIDLSNDNNVVIIDDNNNPILIEDLKVFLNDVLDCYFTATNKYYTKYSNIVSQRSIEMLVDIND